MKPRSFIMTLLILALLLPGTTTAQRPASPSNSPDSGHDRSRALHHEHVVYLPFMAIDRPGMHSLVGQIGGVSQDVVVQGRYAYVGVGPRLEVIDISDPANLRSVGKTQVLADVVAGVAVSGNYAFIAAGRAGLYVIDVTDPSHPQEIVRREMPAWSTSDVAVAGSYAYVAHEEGMQILDVSNPVIPATIGAYDAPDAPEYVAVAGDYAYVTGGYRGSLHIVRISDPAHPQEVASIPGSVQGLAVAGDYLFLSLYTGLVRILDVSSPANPRPVGELGIYAPYGIAVAGQYAFVASYRGLHIVDVEALATDPWVAFLEIPGLARNVIVAGLQAYVVADGTGLHAIDISTLETPVEIGAYDSSLISTDVGVSGSYAYVGGSREGERSLRVVNVADPITPREVGSVSIPWPNRVVVRGDRAYVLDPGSNPSKLRILDVANPSVPIEVGQYDLPSMVEGDLAVGNNYAYVRSSAGLHVIDVTTPSAPSQVSLLHTNRQRGAVALNGALVYLVDGSLLKVVDVSDPANPHVVGTYTAPADDFWCVKGLASVDRYAYFTCGYDETYYLKILDVSVPTAPREAGSYRLPTWAGAEVEVVGSTAYIANYYGGLEVVDVSDPLHPAQIAHYDLPGIVWRVSVVNGTVYVPAEEAGLVILR